MKERIVFLDNIRGFAILLVVWGHLLQAIYCYDYAAVEQNVIYQMIYSFHMALFFMVSGYFSCYDNRKTSVLNTVLKKACGLLIPFFVVGLYYMHRCYSVDGFNGLWVSAKYGYWFLWVLFEISLLNILYYKLKTYLKWSVCFDFAYWIGVTILFELLYRYSSPSYYGFFSFKYLAGNIPFFAFGLMLNKTKFNSLVTNKYVFSIAAIIYIVVFSIFSSTILMKTIPLNIVRCAALIVIFNIFYQIRNFRIVKLLFSYIGKLSLDIYIFHYFIIVWWLWVYSGITIPITNEWGVVAKVLTAFGCSVVVCIVCSLFGRLLRTNIITSFFILGQLPNKRTEHSITYHFRNHKCGYSIAHVFEPVVAKLQSEYKIEVTEMPSQHSMPWDVIINGVYVLWHRNKYGINHVTGHIHDALLFLLGCRTVLTVHDLVFIDNVHNPVKKAYKWLFWLYLPVRIADRITCISEETRRNLLKHCPWAADKTVVIYDAVDERYKYTEHKFNEECPRILHIGTFWNKNLERVIEALLMLNHNYELRIVGELTDEMKQKLEGVNYTQVANLTEDEMLHEYINCDIVCFPSVYEGFGMPIVEGQAVGRPVLTSDMAPMNEVAGDAALLVNPQSVEAICNGLQQLITNEDLRNNLIQKGLVNVERFNLDNISNQYKKVYEEQK